MGRKNYTKKEAPRVVPPSVQHKPIAHGQSALAMIAITFATIVVVLEVIAELFIDWSRLQAVTAAVSTWLLQWSGLGVTRQGINVMLPNARWEIVADCTAIGAQVIFIAFVLAVPSTIRAKVIGIIAGVPFIFLANILRLVILGWLTVLSPPLGSFFHDFVWQMGFLLLVVAMWLAWIEWVVKNEKNTAVSA